jgi:hypothetical protein
VEVDLVKMAGHRDTNERERKQLWRGVAVAAALNFGTLLAGITHDKAFPSAIVMFVASAFAALAGRKPYPHGSVRGALSLKNLDLTYPLERRHVAGAVPNAFLNARENAASES